MSVKQFIDTKLATKCSFLTPKNYSNIETNKKS